MLDRVEVVSDLNNKVLTTFPLKSMTGGEEFILKSIDGLGPVKSDIAQHNYATDPGGFFSTSHIGMRSLQLVIQLVPRGNRTASDLRQSLYRFLEVDNTIWIRLVDDKVGPIQILGRVESNVGNPFTRDLVHHVSIICPEPYFRSLTRKSITGTTNTPTSIWGYSNGPTPFHLKVDVITPVSNIRVWVGDKEGLMLNTSTLPAGQQIWLSTEPGNKFIRTKPLDGGSWSNGLSMLYSGGLDTTFGNANQAFMDVRTNPTDAQLPYEVLFIPRWVGI